MSRSRRLSKLLRRRRHPPGNPQPPRSLALLRRRWRRQDRLPPRRAMLRRRRPSQARRDRLATPAPLPPSSITEAVQPAPPSILDGSAVAAELTPSQPGEQELPLRSLRCHQGRNNRRRLPVRMRSQQTRKLAALHPERQMRLRRSRKSLRRRQRARSNLRASRVVRRHRRAKSRRQAAPRRQRPRPAGHSEEASPAAQASAQTEASTAPPIPRAADASTHEHDGPASGARTRAGRIR